MENGYGQIDDNRFERNFKKRFQPQGLFYRNYITY